MDRYHGSARPNTGPEDALFRDLSQAARQQVRAARKQLRDNRRQWIVVAGASPTTTPMWTSRQGWLSELAAWTETTAGSAELADKRLRPALLLRVAEAWPTGRSRQRQALRGDQRHHRMCGALLAAHRHDRKNGPARSGPGGRDAPRHWFRQDSASRRRPSVWHLISRDQPVDNARICDLPPSLCDRRLSHVGKRSPSIRTRLPSKNSSKPNSQRRHTPRPLRLQKIAAADHRRKHRARFSASWPHLRRIHPIRPGPLHLDSTPDPKGTERRHAPNGWSWPNHIESPDHSLPHGCGGYHHDRSPPRHGRSPRPQPKPQRHRPQAPRRAQQRSHTSAHTALAMPHDAPSQLGERRASAAHRWLTPTQARRTHCARSLHR